MLTDPSRFRRLGEGVKIYDLAKLVREEVIEIGDGTQIDDFSFINGGRGVVLGRFNHVCSFVTVIGGGELVTGDYVGISAGCRLVTATQHYGDGMRMVPVVPPEQQEVVIGRIVLEKDVFLGSNAVVFPNVTIGEGAIIGAGAVVNRDVAPWTINVGMPARRVGLRPRVRFP